MTQTKKNGILAWLSQLNDSKERFGSREWGIVYGKILLGCIIFALADLLFAVPYGLAPGGVYGLMSVFNNLWGSPMSLVIYMDVTLLIIGTVFLGPKFGLKTILSIILIWAVTWFCEHIFYIPQYGYYPIIHSGDMISVADYQALGDQLQKMYMAVRPFEGGEITQYFMPDYVLTTLAGGLAYGLGIGIIFSAGATSGGSDIVAMIVNKYTHISLGTLVIIVDSTIALTAFLIGGDIRMPIYSIILIYIEGKVIDVIVDTKVNKTMWIITDKVDEVKQIIVDKLERSGTVFTGTGMYRGEKRNMIHTCVSREEYKHIKYTIKEVDPKCFITVFSNTETLGEGFDRLPSKGDIDL